MELVRPYVVTAPRYPSFHAPDNHFDFPLDEMTLGHEFPYTYVTPHGFYPLYRQPEALVEHYKHYGMRLDIAAPPITIAAKQIYFARSEMAPYEIPLNLPVDRPAAEAQGQTFPAPTQYDFREFNFHRGVKSVDLGNWDWRSELTEEDGQMEDDGVWRKGLKSKSSNWDNDWQRWTFCYDPWAVSNLKGVVYTYGTLQGLWTGRMLVSWLFCLYHRYRAFFEFFTPILSYSNFSSFLSLLRRLLPWCLERNIPTGLRTYRTHTHFPRSLT